MTYLYTNLSINPPKKLNIIHIDYPALKHKQFDDNYNLNCYKTKKLKNHKTVQVILLLLTLKAMPLAGCLLFLLPRSVAARPLS